MNENGYREKGYSILHDRQRQPLVEFCKGCFPAVWLTLSPSALFISGLMRLFQSCFPRFMTPLKIALPHFRPRKLSAAFKCFAVYFLIIRFRVYFIYVTRFFFNF